MPQYYKYNFCCEVLCYNQKKNSSKNEFFNRIELKVQLIYNNL